MDSIKFRVEEEIPVVAEADVVVVGGGPGGLGAAIMAARYGANVILVERYGMLGGMATYGEITPFMWNHFKASEDQAFPEAMDRPVYPEWIRKMSEYLPPTLRNEHAEEYAREGVDAPFTHIISKDIAPMAAEEMCLEAGVRILYHHNLVRTIVEDGVIRAAVFTSKSGFVAIRAKNFVDATGDADLTVLAGGKTEIGGPSGHCQPMTLCFKLDHVDKSRMPNRQEWAVLYEAAKASGKVNCPREDVLIFNHYDPTVVHFNTTRIIHKSGVNGMELSEAELEGHRQFREILNWLREDVPGFEECQVRSIAGHIGIRESRRIVGIRQITSDSFHKREKFEDAICRCNYDLDIHSPDGSGTSHCYMSNMEYYEVPYGCVVPAGLKNLTVGGRPVSADHAMHASLRVIPPACSLGQAAGVAAAMSAKTGIPCDELDGKEVRAALKELGAFL